MFPDEKRWVAEGLCSGAAMVERLRADGRSNDDDEESHSWGYFSHVLHTSAGVIEGD